MQQKKTTGILIKGARQHNLKNFDLEIPLNSLNVVTGPSGCGKSSLAFHTIYAEGQRRYVETFSPYIRQFLERMEKPHVDEILHIPPAIAIQQNNQVKTSRSTVGSITEINDYFKQFFTRKARVFCPNCNNEIKPDTTKSISDWLFQNWSGEQVLINFPINLPEKRKAEDCFDFFQTAGYMRIWAYNKIYRTDEPDKYTRKLLPQIVEIIHDRIKVEEKQKARISEAIEKAMIAGKKEIIIRKGKDKKQFSQDWICADCNVTLPKLNPHLFSFNNPVGACPTCQGHGKTIGISLKKAIPNHTLSLIDGAVKPFQTPKYAEIQRYLLRCADLKNIDIYETFGNLPKADQDWVFYGEANVPKDSILDGIWYGVKGFFDRLQRRSHSMSVRILLSKYRDYTTCPDCKGTKIKSDIQQYLVGGKNLPELWNMQISELYDWLTSLEYEKYDKSSKMLYDELLSRINYLCQVGLNYLSLARESRSLSGGEMQRVELTTCLGASLVNTLFVLDEPSIGLHMRDVSNLIKIIKNLRDKGNTLLVVEHDESVILSADNIIDIGPGRGESGGNLVYNGDLNGIASRENSLTADYLFGKKTIAIPKERRKINPDRKLLVKNASENNLQNLDVEIPLGVFACLTGISGSGKSTLAHKVIYQNLARKKGFSMLETEIGKCDGIENANLLDEAIVINQSPLTRTPRSTPILYLGAFDVIRFIFSETLPAQQRNLFPSAFSFNTGLGRCQRCLGSGYERIDMQFLSDIFVICPECEGKRYTDEILKIKINGKNIFDVLNMTAGEALDFFSSKKPPFDKLSKHYENVLQNSLKTLEKVGLGYLRLGQPLNQVSGGEAQRLKLARRLLENTSLKLKSKKWRTNLLIFDEPTTGLHFDDVKRLISVLQDLVDSGDSILVIEHNLEVVKCADFVIDLGPEGGKDGGKIVAQGTPEEIAKNARSVTGKYLKEIVAHSKGKKNVESTENNGVALNGKKTFANKIEIFGARTHNLKNIDVNIPHNELVVLTGLSGSGKSSLAFDVIYAEGQRRFLDSMSAYARQFISQIEKPDIDLITGLPPTVAIEQRISRGGGKSTVATVTEIYNYLRLLFTKVGVQYCPKCDLPVEGKTFQSLSKSVREKIAELKPNSAELGDRIYVLSPLVRGRKGFHKEIALWAEKMNVEKLFIDGKFTLTANFKSLTRFQEHFIDAVAGEFNLNKLQSGKGEEELNQALESALEWGKGLVRIFRGNKEIMLVNVDRNCPECGRSFPELEPKLFSYNSRQGCCGVCNGFGKISDVSDNVEFDYADDRAWSKNLESYLTNELNDQCPACEGERLNSISRSIKIGNSENGIGIGALCKKSVKQAGEVIRSLEFTGFEETLTRDIVPEILQRLDFLTRVGLSHLQLDRSALTLSGGESQRIRLAAQLGSNLRNVLYVLDEPSIGLHPRDNSALLEILCDLRDKGNSLIVVEHDEDTIQRSDYLLDLGPGAGRFGGEIVAHGNFNELSKSDDKSLTLRHLANISKHDKNFARKILDKKDKSVWLKISKACANNLKAIDVEIPIGSLVAITGVSGAGKSTILKKVIYPAVREFVGKKSKVDTKSKRLAKKSKAKKLWGKVENAENFNSVYLVDQSPIGKTIRSAPATYIKVFDEIRKVFAKLPLAQIRGYGVGRFSFNNKEGQCVECNGVGQKKVEMSFMPTALVHCEKCDGQRFNDATLQVEYRGANIADVLAMTIDEAGDFFKNHPRISRVLKLMSETGTGYLQLGQPSPTLSGGEAQRIKLVAELARGVNLTAMKLSAEKKLRKGNLYLIEEPSIGLHVQDVKNLIKLLQKLVEQGHTVIIVEHQLDLIASADYVLDIGPEAGDSGGEVVVSGTPEEIILSKDSRTAPFLKKHLNEYGD